MMLLLYIVSFGVVAMASGSLDFLLSSKDAETLKRDWSRCCERQLCVRNSCFFMLRRRSTWASMRQRCQNQYPNWSTSLDLFRIYSQEDAEKINRYLMKEHYSSSRRGVWTSGLRCPTVSTENPASVVYVNQWVSNDTFPDFIENAISSGTEEDEEDFVDGCKFLVFVPASIGSKIKYEFQNQSTHQAALCEFRYPGGVKMSTPAESTPTTALTTEPTTSALTTTKQIKSQTLETALDLHRTENVKTTVTISTKIPVTSTFANKFCKGRKVAGVHWPDAGPGQMLNVSCPDGMTGFAQWQCSETTHDFTPSQPHIQDCKHKWITDLEKNVDAGGDALHLSRRLAVDSASRSLSHGDVSALVDVSRKLDDLFAKQAYGEPPVVADDEPPPRSLSFTDAMVAAMSNILRAETKDAWDTLPENHQTRAASSILRLVTNVGTRLSCIKRAKSNDKLQFNVSKENIELQTFALDGTGKEQEEEVRFIGSGGGIWLPASPSLQPVHPLCAGHRSTAVGVLYRRLGDFLKDEHLTSSTSQVATQVISFSLGSGNQSIPLPDGKVVYVILEHSLETSIEEGFIKNPRCMFWNFSLGMWGAWDNTGCWRLASNNTHTACACNHLTNFAVLVDVTGNITKDNVLTIMTYVCCGLSSVTLLITLICFIVMKSLHGRRTIITGNLCFSLLFSNLLILFGLDQTENEVLCAAIAGLLHFWILSAFCWMLVEGYHLYRMVIVVFERGSTLSVKFYYLFAYGLPLTIVGISAGIRNDNYARKNYCWLSPDQGLVWSFVGPACGVILINVLIFVLTMRSASNVRIKREQTTLKKIKSWTRGSMSVMCLLGLTWCLGLFYIDPKMRFFSYIFTFLNGLQGAFIFLFHVLLNDKVSSKFMNCKKTKQDAWRKFQLHTSSQQFKTSTRTSTQSTGLTVSNGIAQIPTAPPLEDENDSDLKPRKSSNPRFSISAFRNCRTCPEKSALSSNISQTESRSKSTNERKNSTSNEEGIFKKL